MEEILAHDGHDAFRKRMAEVNAKRQKQQRKVDEARWLVEATRRNYDIIHADNMPLEYYKKAIADEAAERHAGEAAKAAKPPAVGKVEAVVAQSGS